MNETEFFDMFVDEQVKMYLEKILPEEALNHGHDKSIIEAFIKNLSYDDRNIIETHINSLVDLFAAHERYLYKCGFLDGLKTMKLISV